MKFVTQILYVIIVLRHVCVTYFMPPKSKVWTHSPLCNQNKNPERVQFCNKEWVDAFLCALCGSPDGLSRPWNMNWKSVQETCHHRTSTNSRPATSSSSCWMSCNHNILPGSHTASNTYQQDCKAFLIPVVFEDSAFLSSCLCLLYNLRGFVILGLVYIHILLSAFAATQFSHGNYLSFILSNLLHIDL